MQSKTSFFNKTIYKKNLTRFAPVWGVYTLCLVLGVLLLYGNGGSVKQFHFANNFIHDMFSILAVVNLGYALVVAQLLFGDLYNARMCNMLHSFPLSRESWFLTNIASGLTFSLVPTAIMAVVAAPLLLTSIFRNAVSLSWYIFLAANLQYVCFFGMAVFAAMCVGNRFTMVAGYGLLNAGASIAYWLIDTVYTPMLYGVITPTALMWNLTPLYHMSSHRFITTEFSLYQLRETFGEKLEGAVATFTVTDEWWRLWMVAAVGLVFLLLALVLYKKRDLECAGDAVAFPFLVPVFQVLCAIFVTTAAQYFLEHYLRVASQRFLSLTVGLVVGWIVAKMLVERSTRIFRLKNFYGLGILAAVFGLSLGLTYLDVLGIETYQPRADKVEKVFFETDWTTGRYVDSPEDIEAMLLLQEDALYNRADSSGTYVLGYDGSWVRYVDSNDHLYDKDAEDLACDYVAQVGIRYELYSGKIIKRRYNVWVSSGAGAIANEYLNQWEELDPVYTDRNEEFRWLDRVMQDFRMMSVSYIDDDELPPVCSSRRAMEGLLEAIRLDCEEGTMAQHPYFHRGYFRRDNEDSERGYDTTDSISVHLASKDAGWGVQVYADSRHTLTWLENNGLLDWEVREEPIPLW